MSSSQTSMSGYFISSTDDVATNDATPAVECNGRNCSTSDKYFLDNLLKLANQHCFSLPPNSLARSHTSVASDRSPEASVGTSTISMVPSLPLLVHLLLLLELVRALLPLKLPLKLRDPSNWT